MVHSRINHVSVVATDLDESTAFYRDVFGMKRVPAPNFSVPVEWLRCGDLTLHLFKRDIDAPDYYHFGLHVDDFESVYQTVSERGLVSDFDEESQTPTVYELPDGSVQLYITDPAGNLVEVNYHDVDALDHSLVRNIVPRAEQRPQTGEAADSRLYMESFLDSIDDRHRSG